MSRFVLLYHVCPAGYVRPSHWDLMLEVREVLRTWALVELPCEWHAAQIATSRIDPTCPTPAASDAVEAEQLGHHRRSYLDYEGPVSGDRGHVHRIDSGTYRGESTSPQIWRLTLHGNIVRGGIVLEQESATAENWVLRCEN